MLIDHVPRRANVEAKTMAQLSSEPVDRVVYPVPFDPSVVDLLGE